MTASACHTPLTSDRFAKPPGRLRTAAMWAAAKAAAGLQNLRGNCCADGFGILMYHRVAEHVSGVDAPTLNVTPARLRQQLAGLLVRGFVSWPLTKLVAAADDSRPIPSNVFAVTFDDGYENNYLHALPILRELNVPATIFVATQYVDTDRPFPFDDWPASGSAAVPPAAWRPLSSDQCYRLLDSGVIELGAHTHSHQRFGNRTVDFRRDTTLCLNVLRDRFEVDRPTFAFPFGEMTPELVEAARQLDLACAVSTRRQRVQAGDDKFQWGRFSVGASDTPAVLAAKLSGWYPMLAAACKKVMRPLTARKSLAGRSGNGLHEGKFRDVARARKAQSQS